MKHEIPKSEWHICKICQRKIKDLAAQYGGSGVYYVDVFREHLAVDHNIDLEKYFSHLVTPKCNCGICAQDVNISKRATNFCWNEYKCGRYPGTLKWSKEAKKSRRGKNNPM